MVCAFSYSAILILLLQNGFISGLITSWPDGKYGLLKPSTGCPKEWTDKDWNYENKGWTDKGYIFQNTDDNYSNNNSSQTLNIEGYVGPSFVLRYFCAKSTGVKLQSIKWPEGKYCIYSKQQDHLGWIKMFDRNNGYEHSYNYVDDFTTFNWYSSIKFHFFCQARGNKKIPISLPITKPFYLLPYGSRDCQQVKWMVATTEWIKYHTRNYVAKRAKQTYGTVPFHELGDRKHQGITMFYCYYESCNYTLTHKEGTFQSPGFPGKYPDGQLCSWRIMVPDNYTIHIRFTNFSLLDNDTLKYYKIVNGLSNYTATFGGNQHPRLTATSDVKFVFSTNVRGNSNGFRAQYRVFMPTKITTTPLATTTNLPTTTTNPTTTTKPPKTPPPTKPLQTNKPTKTKTEQGKTKTDKPTRKITQTTHWNTSNNGASSGFKGSRLFSCDMTLQIVVMVIPLVCCILVILLVVDIVYRCRHTKNKANTSRNDDRLAVNMTYERGDIILDQTSDTTTDASTVNTVDDQPQSHDEPPDYEDVDYTQLNEIPPPRRSTKRQECHALEPIGYDTRDVFYHVLEHPNIESSDGPQFHAREPHGNAAPEVFYHTLESPTDLNRPTYQNLSEVNHYTMKPVYESAENSDPLVEANNLYDNSIA